MLCWSNERKKKQKIKIKRQKEEKKISESAIDD